MKEKISQRKTKILVTVGPAIESPEILEKLFENGVNGFRFNFSHGSMQYHLENLAMIREISERMGKSVTCFADLQGPKIRLGKLAEEPVDLKEDEEVILYPSGNPPEELKMVALPISYARLTNDLSSGDEVFFSDGQIQLKVKEVKKDFLTAIVKVGGSVWSKKGVNIPGTKLSVPSFTDIDRKNLERIIHEDFDTVAMSFVRSAEDLKLPRRILDTVAKPIDLIAKIESKKALEELDEIINAVEGVMVARGDLGVEIGAERVPFCQKDIIERANRQGKIVITATQMLETMINDPYPTRAEVSDVANAVLDGSDVVMLSGETAVGSYPVETVKTMSQIVRATEEDFHQHMLELNTKVKGTENKIAVSVSNAATRCSNEINASAIIVPTASGFSARMVSKTRPNCPIIALCPYQSTLQKVNLYNNVISYSFEVVEDTDELMEKALEIVIEEGYAGSGDEVVLLAGLPLAEPGVTNFIHALEV